jgi:hypothetical protein
LPTLDDVRALKQIARQFKNSDLDTLYANFIQQAVADAEYDLRTVTQKAGLINEFIEDDDTDAGS